MMPGIHPEFVCRAPFQRGGVSMVKKAYRKPFLRRLGLLRQVTRFSF
jgi:hypothetical protein